jgi:hypothetical protein
MVRLRYILLYFNRADSEFFLLSFYDLVHKMIVLSFIRGWIFGEVMMILIINLPSSVRQRAINHRNTRQLAYLEHNFRKFPFSRTRLRTTTWAQARVSALYIRIICTQDSYTPLRPVCCKFVRKGIVSMAESWHDILKLIFLLRLRDLLR